MWDFAKRVFGRSRSIFINVLGILLMAFTEMSDSLLSFDWDAVAKHETAIMIGFGVQILNVIVRIYTTGPVSFGKLEDEDHDVPVYSVPPVVPLEDVNPVEDTPKAE